MGILAVAMSVSAAGDLGEEVRRLGSTAYRLPRACGELAWVGGVLRASTVDGVATVDAEGKVTVDPQLPCFGLEASRDGAAFACALDQGELRVVDVRGRQKRRDGEGGEVVDVAWLPDGRLVALADLERPPAPPGVHVRHEALAHLSVWDPHRARPWHLELRGCHGVRLAPFAGDVAVLCADHLSLVDLDQGGLQALPAPAPRNLWGSSDGETLIVSTDAGFEIRRGAVLERGSLQLSAAAASGAWIALAGERQIELRGPSPRKIPFEGPVTSLAIQGDTVAACAGHRVAWWDATTGRPLTSWSGHTAPVTAAVLSRDGRVAVSGSRDGDVIVWDVTSGQERARLRLPEPTSVEEVAWNEGVASAFADEQWHDWTIEPGWREGPPVPHRIEGQPDGTLLIHRLSAND